MTFFIRYMTPSTDQPAVNKQVPGTALSWAAIREAVLEQFKAREHVPSSDRKVELTIIHEWHCHPNVRESYHFIYAFRTSMLFIAINGYACTGLPYKERDAGALDDDEEG